MSKLSDTRVFTTSDGESYEVLVNKLEPELAYLLVAKLGKVVIPAIVAMKKGGTTELMPVVDRLFESLTPELAKQVKNDLFAATTVIRTDREGNQMKFDSGTAAAVNNAFRGQVKTMFEVLRFALEVNFADFFDVRGLAASTQKMPSA